MFNKVVITLCLFTSSLGICSASDPNTYLLQGRSFLFNRSLSGIRMANDIFDKAMGDPNCFSCPSNRNLRFFHALSQLAMLIIPDNSEPVTSMIEIANQYDVQIMGDAIEKLVLSPNLKKEMIRKGIERARSFSWQKTAELTFSALERASKTT